MALIAGKYKHDRNENIDEYFAAVGVPYLARKMMVMSSPTMEVSQDGDYWIIKNISVMRTVEMKFKLGEEYDENMPTASLKSITTLENGNELVTESTAKDTGVKTTRRYAFSEEGCVVTLKHETLSTPAKRYFLRVKQ